MDTGHESLLTAVNPKSKQQGEVGEGAVERRGLGDLNLSLWDQGLPWLS